MDDRLKALGAKLKAAYDKVEAAEEALKESKKELELVAQTTVPEALENMGLEEFTVEDIGRIVVNEKIRAAPPAKRRAEAYKWLIENGHGDIVKTHVVTSFDRSEIDDAQALLAELQGKFTATKLDTKVEGATMTAWVKGQLDDGKEFPLDLFGVHQFKTAEIKKPRAKK